MKPLAAGSAPPAQRRVEPEKEEEEDLQAKEISGQTSEAAPETEGIMDGLQNGGWPLPESMQVFFGPRFGYDFSRVRVHTDTEASESALKINSRAYTLGQDIVFGAGQYSPGTETGKKLLAHELVHVCQQNGTPLSAARQHGVQEVSPVAIQREEREEKPATIDEWETQAEGIAQENMKQTITAWTDFIIDSEIYLLEKSDLERVCEMLLIPFGAGGVLRRAALVIIGWLRAETVKMHVDLQKEEVKWRIESVVREAIDEWSTKGITKKAQELRKSGNPTIPELPRRVPSDLKYSLYLAWMRASTDFGMGTAQMGYRQVPAYTSKAAPGIGAAHHWSMVVKTRRLEQELGLSQEKIWHIYRDPVLIQNVIKRFFLEEAGVAVTDASGMEKEGSALCIRGEGNELGIGRMEKERTATVTDASKANTAAHGYVGELFAGEKDMVRNGDKATVALTWNSIQCWTPEFYTETITHPEERYYDSATGQHITIPEQEERIQRYRPDMEPHPKRPLLVAKITIPRLGLNFNIQK